MIIRGKDVPAPDAGEVFGQPKMGIAQQWLVSSKTGDDRYRRSFAMRRYTSQPGAPGNIVMHYHDYQEAMFIISGHIRVKTEDEDWTEMGPGDVLYTYPNQSHMVGGVDGNEVVDVICCIDQSGESLNPEKNAYTIKLDPWRL